MPLVSIPMPPTVLFRNVTLRYAYKWIAVSQFLRNPFVIPSYWLSLFSPYFSPLSPSNMSMFQNENIMFQMVYRVSNKRFTFAPEIK